MNGINDFSFPLEELQETLRALNRGWASQKVKNIIDNCSSFKIGKTGETLEERRSQPDYVNEYPEIASVFKSTSKREVDDMESYLISRYFLNEKCDNLKSGIRSKNDTMREDATEYNVYVVWK